LASARAWLALLLFGIGLSPLYRFVAAALLSALWTGSDAVLRYAVVALGVAGIIFGAHLTALAFAVGEAYAASLRRCAHVLALSLKAVCAAATGVNWFAAAGE
jgi:hypothetical protein